MAELQGSLQRDYSIEFSLGSTDEPISISMFHLCGENAIYDIIELCKKNKWQAYDTGIAQMVDVDYPIKNGYENHQNYVRQILGEK